MENNSDSSNNNAELIESEMIQTMNQEELEKYYGDITNAIKIYANQERDLWLEMNKRIDPEFVQNQSKQSNTNKINQAKLERENKFNVLKKQYLDNILKYHTLLQNQHNNLYISSVQKYIDDSKKQTISSLNSDIMTLRKQISLFHGTLLNYQHNNQSMYYTSSFLFTNACIYLYYFFLPTKYLFQKFTLVFILFCIYFLTMGYRYLSNVNKKIQNQLGGFNFKPPTFNAPSITLPGIDINAPNSSPNLKCVKYEN